MDGTEYPIHARTERPTTQTQTRMQVEHLYNWDRLRVFGSLDIIGLHLTGTHLLAGVGLPTFLIMSIALTVRSAAARPFHEILTKRVRHVVVPWLFWSCLLAAEIWARRALGDPNPVKFTPAMLLYGPQIHLWFLPFVALAGPFAAGVQRCTTTWSARAIVCAVVVLGSAAVAAAPRLVGLWPLEQWAFSLPAVCLGFGLGTLLKRAPETSPVRRVALPFALCVCLVCLALPDSYIYGKRYVSAVLLIAVCSVLPNRPDPVSKLLSPLMLGIYVLHMFVYHRVIEPALDRLAFDPHGVARVFVTFCVTATIVALCRCTPLRRVL